MNLSEELALLKEQLEAERTARLRAEQLLREQVAKTERLAFHPQGFSFADLSGSSLADGGEIDRKLQEQRVFFEEILNKTPADIIVADTQYRYLFANPSAVPDPHLRQWMIGKTNEEFCAYARRPDRIARARRQVFDKVLRLRRMIQWEEETFDQQGGAQYYLRT